MAPKGHKYKRHLLVGATRGPGRTACGLSTSRQWTTNPAEVTCASCTRSIHMADAEVAARHQPQNRNV